MIERDDLSALPKAQRERYERQYQSAEQAINVGQLIEMLKEYPQDLPIVGFAQQTKNITNSTYRD